jgi:hypothetical protein
VKSKEDLCFKEYDMINIQSEAEASQSDVMFRSGEPLSPQSTINNYNGIATPLRYIFYKYLEPLKNYFYKKYTGPFDRVTVNLIASNLHL